MCGIGGYFGHRVVGDSTNSRILEALARRGPDAHGRVAWTHDLQRTDALAPNALLHTRLSIRDPRPIADQPMVNDAGDIWLCYNGEVYGWEEDARALERDDAPFHTKSDTEFILRGYEAWGLEALLPKLRGMFAFAILDLRQRCVWLARDRMGLKPLIYYHVNGEFAFGSLVRAVLPYVPRAQRAFRPESIDAYLAHRYVPAPHTIVRDVARLPNAHWARFDLGSRELRIHEYWQPVPEPGDFLQTLDQSIRLRTVADRPVGVFLSNGIDSTAIASRTAALGYTNLATFSAAFDVAAMDESGFARENAKALHMPNVTVPVPSRGLQNFDTIVRDLDEPFADPSSFPLWYLARETSKQVKVVLAGDGGDELFGGYKRYGQHLRTQWRKNYSLGFLKPGPTLDRRGSTKWRLEISAPWEEAYALRFSGFTPAQRAMLQPNLGQQPFTHWRMPKTGATNAHNALFEIDRLNYLPEYILRKADLMTMAHGLEARAPLLDQQVVARATALPDHERYTDPAKLVLRNAVPTSLPYDPYAQKKRGFNPPLTGWLREDLANRLVDLSTRLQTVTNGQIEARATDQLLARYASDEGYAEQILQLLMLDTALHQLRAEMQLEEG